METVYFAVQKTTFQETDSVFPVMEHAPKVIKVTCCSHNVGIICAGCTIANFLLWKFKYWFIADSKIFGTSMVTYIAVS